MRVLVIGAYGLVGSHVTARLLAAGHEVVGAGRNVQAAALRQPRVRWVRLDLSRANAKELAPVLQGVDAVANCAGALQDSPTDNLRHVHVDGLRALAEACRAQSVRRLVHVSAVGIEGGRNTFSRSKADAEAMLRGTDLEWVILRPGLVFAPTAFGGSALLRGLAAFPFFIPVVHSRSPVQVVAAEDVAEAVLRAIDPQTPARFTCDLVAPRAISLGGLLIALRGWLGFGAAPLAPFPSAAGLLIARIADGLALLGWRSPLRSNTLGQLESGVVGDPQAASRHLQLVPRDLGEILASNPSGVQERWFSRLYFLKPAVLATLALFWAFSGCVGLLGVEEAGQVLATSGMEAGQARALVVGGALIDLGLGALVCFRRTAPLALVGMLLVTGLYLIGASALRPDLWLDPLGVLAKAIPAAILALVGLALMDDR